MRIISKKKEIKNIKSRANGPSRNTNAGRMCGC